MTEQHSAINIVIDETEPNDPRFVEINDDQRRSIRIGERSEYPNGLTFIRVTAADLGHPPLPMREQIAWQKLRSLRDDLFESTDAAFEPDEVIEELDAVLALLQKEADR